MIEREVPPGEKVFSFEQIPAAWTTREILAAYTGAQNEVLSDTLSAALSLESVPVPAQVFRFEPRQLRRLRAIQTAQPNREMWSVNEFQIFSRGMPLLPDGNWRLSANPNPWDVPLAFDNSAVTRWRSWDRAKPGMFIEVDFGKPLLIDEVRLVSRTGRGPNPSGSSRHGCARRMVHINRSTVHFFTFVLETISGKRPSAPWWRAASTICWSRRAHSAPTTSTTIPAAWGIELLARIRRQASLRFEARRSRPSASRSCRQFTACRAPWQRMTIPIRGSA